MVKYDHRQQKESLKRNILGCVSPAARAGDCKSLTSETTQVRVLPHPFFVKRSGTGAAALRKNGKFKNWKSDRED